MTVDDLKLSDSTKGFLNANNLTVPKLVAKRDDLTSIKGIGPARASEIERALEAATTSPTPALEPTPAPKKEPPTPLVREATGPKIPKVSPPDLVVYTDTSGSRMNSRVAAVLEGGVLNLQAFTRAGGSRRVEKVPYDAAGSRGTWKELILP